MLKDLNCGLINSQQQTITGRHFILYLNWTKLMEFYIQSSVTNMTQEISESAQCNCSESDSNSTSQIHNLDEGWAHSWGVESYFSSTARTNKTHTMVSFVVLYWDYLTWRSLDIASEDMNSPFWKWHTKHITWYWLWPRSSSPSTRAFSIWTSWNTNKIQNNVIMHQTVFFDILCNE
jgi:hypothetical protein